MNHWEPLYLLSKELTFVECKKFNVICDTVFTFKITQFRKVQSEKRKLDVVVMELELRAKLSLNSDLDFQCSAQ